MKNAAKPKIIVAGGGIGGLTAALSLIEPAIMIFMGLFVAFVMIALYMPIFSLADTIH